MYMNDHNHNSNLLMSQYIPGGLHTCNIDTNVQSWSIHSTMRDEFNIVYNCIVYPTLHTKCSKHKHTEETEAKGDDTIKLQKL